MIDVQGHGSRLDDIVRFYELLARLEKQLGGKSRLADCHGRMDWPERGMYVFFEIGEERTTSGTGPRVVRVGTHALRPTNRTTLWSRLSQHRGHDTGSFAGGGNSRGSVFRKHVGPVIAKRESINIPTWGVGNIAPRSVREAEHPLECRVSHHIRSMPFLWLSISDASPAGCEVRRSLETNSIGLISNAGELATADPIDPPSATWLGRFCKSEKVVTSGLWNSNHVLDGYESRFLDELERCIKHA